MSRTRHAHDQRLPAAGANPEHRDGWRDLLKRIALAPVRLHRYRAVHTQILRDALCAADCGPFDYRDEDGAGRQS